MIEFPDTLRNRVRSLVSAVFGDQYGVALWLGLLVAFGLYWRVGIFVSDTYTTANTLVAVADGHLSITKTPYSLTLGSQPGLHRSGGLLYGRNYGQVALAVPIAWALQALSVVVVPRLLLLGVWTGVALAFVAQLSELGVGSRVSRRTTLWAGSGFVAVLFLAGVSSATALSDDALPLAAFQLSTMLAAATTAVVLYRLVAIWHDRSVGLAAGVAVGLASPVGFWASLPKRHVLVGLLALSTVYAFARSRLAYRDSAHRRALTFRVGAYLCAGFVTWTHAFEALFLVSTLALVDLATARRNSVPHLLAVGAALFVASLPMLLTNYLISGNPVKPPRLLPGVSNYNVEFVPENWEAGGSGGGPDTDGGGADTTGNSAGSDSAGSTGDEGSDGTGGADAGGGGSTGGDSTGGQSGDPFLSPLFETIARAIDSLSPAFRFVSTALFGGFGVLSDPSRLSHIFLRSGNIPGVNYSINAYETIELTLLESVPVLGALVSLPAVAVRSLRRRSLRSGFDPRQLSPRRQTDLLVASLAAVFTLVYLSRLPLRSQLTVRYLLPVVPLAVYGLVRVPAVAEAVRTSGRWLVGGYVASVVGGLALCLAAVAGLGLALGEAVQFHALLNLGGAAVCASAVLGRLAVPDRVPTRAVALALALPAGLTTAYVVLSALVYFRYGTFALDVVRLVAESLPTV